MDDLTCHPMYKENPKPDKTRILIIEIEIGRNLSWNRLRDNVSAGVDLTMGALFKSMRVAGSPDPYLLSDPDDPPKDWK